MITLICGPMYSGKSTTLIQKMERYIYANKRICLIRPVKDDRGYFTHGGIDNVRKILKDGDGYLEITEFKEQQVKEIINKYDAVFVDEYFMIKGCKLLCDVLPENKRCDIYFAGLLATSENELFSETLQILPYCDDIIKLNGVCTGVDEQGCGSQHGNYSGYFGKASKTSDILVGDNVYRCLCRKCYKKAFNKL